MHQFLARHESLNKNLIITHLNEIFRAVSQCLLNSLQGCFLQRDFTLKSLPYIKSDFSVPKNKTCRIEFNNLEFDKIAELWKCHKHMSRLECQFLFQLVTSVRVNNTYGLKSNTTFMARRCSKCSHYPCAIITPACLDSVHFYKTKTESIRVPLPFPVTECYQRLLSTDTDYSSLNYSKYQRFLHDSFGVSSHTVRKYICNFYSNSLKFNNTGRWKLSGPNNNMVKHYQHEDNKLIEFYSRMILVLSKDSTYAGSFCF